MRLLNGVCGQMKSSMQAPVDNDLCLIVLPEMQERRWVYIGGDEDVDLRLMEEANDRAVPDHGILLCVRLRDKSRCIRMPVDCQPLGRW
jgi:hypothetical protein